MSHYQHCCYRHHHQRRALSVTFEILPMEKVVKGAFEVRMDATQDILSTQVCKGVIHFIELHNNLKCAKSLQFL